MKLKLDLVTIFTEDVENMRKFYTNIMKLEEANKLENYVEYKFDTIRFAVCNISEMKNFSDEYLSFKKGNNFELAFQCETRGELDKALDKIITNGGRLVSKPRIMAWGHYTALFTDPDGNIHELFVS